MWGTHITVCEEGFWAYLCYFQTALKVLIQFFNSNFACEIHIYFCQTVVPGIEKKDYISVFLSAND